MPWQTPSLRTCREMVRDNVSAALSGASFVGNTVLRVMSDAQAGLAHLVLRYIDWLSKQLLPDTAETEWLDRHGQIWLTNADGSTGRKQATYASGTVLLTGTPGRIVPAGSQLEGDGIGYEITDEIVIGEGPTTDAKVRALDPGKAGNDPLSLAFTTPIAGVDGNAAVVELKGGTDTETYAELRTRVLLRIRNPPMGGSAADYELWALAVPGVTRAWCYPNEMGVGTVTVRFMMDDLRASSDGIPTQADCEVVAAYLDTVRPVAVKDIYVVAPIPYPIDVPIENLMNDDAATRGAITTNLLSQFRSRSKPGQTWFRAWTDEGIAAAPGVESYSMTGVTDTPMPDNGHMPMLGTITYV